MKEIILSKELKLINISPRKEIEMIDITPRKRNKTQRKQKFMEKEAGFFLISLLYASPFLMVALWLMGL